MTDPRTGAKATVIDRTRDGTIPMALGGVLLAWAVRRYRRNTGGVVLRALLGSGLLALGVRQRRADGRTGPESTSRHRGSESTGPAPTDRSSDGDSVEFVQGADQESQPKPHLDADQTDPRYSDESETVKVDLNDVTMADEESEAAQPTDEHAQPASTEETEPEVTPPEDASHVQADEPDDEADDDGTRTDEAVD